VNRRYTFVMRAMSATEKVALGLNAMTDDFAPAMFACRRKRMNSALERIEISRNSIHHNLQCFVILVVANFAFHENYFSFCAKKKR
jgi:hypothetical protein